MSKEEAMKVQLEELKREHRDLDDQITEMTEGRAGDAIAIRLLKKRKLVLKDKISWIEDQLYPDIIA